MLKECESWIFGVVASGFVRLVDFVAASEPWNLGFMQLTSHDIIAEFHKLLNLAIAYRRAVGKSPACCYGYRYPFASHAIAF